MIQSLFQSQSLGVQAMRGQEYPCSTPAGFAGTDCALMVVDVERYMMVTRFQQVMEMDVPPCR
jgi:hypothetical protein